MRRSFSSHGRQGFPGIVAACGRGGGTCGAMHAVAATHTIGMIPMQRLLWQIYISASMAIGACDQQHGRHSWGVQHPTMCGPDLLARSPGHATLTMLHLASSSM